MTNTKKRIGLILVMSICCGLIFQGQMFALMKGNDSEIAFTEGLMQGIGNQRSSSASLLKEYLIEGASAYLDSYTKTMAFMKELEIGELRGYDFASMRQYIDEAIESMEAAEYYYVNLKNIADVTPYNPVVVSALKHFPYASFRVDLNLNKSIFKAVQDFLQWGDVRGAYQQMLLDTINILDTLYRVKYAIDTQNLPNGKRVWQLNQNYAESLLFGQYMAGVFTEIQKNL